jgi:hypothetical protein
VAGKRVKTDLPAVDRSLADVWRRLDALERVGKTTRVRKYSALALTGVAGGTYSNVTKDTDGSLTTNTATTTVRLPLVFDVGERITAVAALVTGTAAGRITMRLKRSSPTGGTATQLGADVVNTLVARPELLQLNNLTETVLADMTSYFLEMSFNTASGQMVHTITTTTEV